MLGRYNIVTDKKYPMSSLLQVNLKSFINWVAQDGDCLLIIDGEIEGSGKSVFAQQVGYYCQYQIKWQIQNLRDKKTNQLVYTVEQQQELIKRLDEFGFTEKNIVFTPKEFKDAVLNAPKFACIVWDEAYQGNSKYRQMSGINQSIQSLLQQIRQRNLFIIIVMPYYFDLNSYIATNRSWALLHVFLRSVLDTQADKSTVDFCYPVLERGFFRFYRRGNKNIMYHVGRQHYNYNVARGDFVGTFERFYTVDEAAYREKKALISFDEEKEEMNDTEYAKECFKRGMEIPTLKAFVKVSTNYLYVLRKKWADQQKAIE